MALLLATTTLHAAPPEPADAGWILQRLARPAPMRTPFVELRDSRLMKAPLRVEGEYLSPDAATLVREVRAPYAETSTIRAGRVSIARAGRGERSVPLDRAPELDGLQASFGALLAGDRAGLERHFRVDARGDRTRWTLLLTPRAPAMAARVRGLALHGRGDTLRCIETQPVKGAPQRTLVDAAAREAAGVSAPAALAALCHGDRAAR